jgi:hypothetical protein
MDIGKQALYLSVCVNFTNGRVLITKLYGSSAFLYCLCQSLDVAFGKGHSPYKLQVSGKILCASLGVKK